MRKHSRWGTCFWGNKIKIRTSLGLAYNSLKKKQQRSTLPVIFPDHQRFILSRLLPKLDCEAMQRQYRVVLNDLVIFWLLLKRPISGFWTNWGPWALWSECSPLREAARQASQSYWIHHSYRLLARHLVDLGNLSKESFIAPVVS